MTVLREMNSRLAISGNVRWVARYGSSRSSAPVRLIAQAPAGPVVAATRSCSSRASSTSEPMSGTELEHPLGLGENRAGGAGIGECEVGACELEPDLDGQPGNAVVEHRPQTVRARQRRAGILRVAPRGARHAPSPRARSRSSSSRRDPPRRRAPVPPVRVPRPRPRLPAWPRGARAVPARGRRRPRRRRPAPARRLPSGRPSRDRLRRAAHARRLG